jgi:hypothetical protein
MEPICVTWLAGKSFGSEQNAARLKPVGGSNEMKRVTGIGGIFFKSDDQENLYQW